MQGNYPISFLAINRLFNSHILERLDSFSDVAKSVLGVQAQLPTASSIAYAIRINKPEYSNYLNAFDEMKLIRIWGIRTTFHSYSFDDWRVILSLISTTENWFIRKMKKQGTDIDYLVEKAMDIIEDVEYFDRNDLINGGISKEYLGPWGDLLIELSNRGYICCSMRKYLGGKKEFRNIRDNLGDLKNQEFQINDSIKHEIVARYFSAYGPATVQDFAHWLGCSLRVAKTYCDLLRDELHEIVCNMKKYYVLKQDYERCEKNYYKFRELDKCWLLPKFDPLLLAYNDKEWIVKNEKQKDIWKTAGQVEGVIVQNWEAVATWKYKIKSGIIDYSIELFDKDYPINWISLNEICSHIAEFRSVHIGSITIRK